MTPEALAAHLSAAAGHLAAPTMLIQRAVLRVEGTVKDQISAQGLVDTGTLLRSVAGVVRTATQGVVGSNVDYAEYQDQGTVYIPAHHFMDLGRDAAMPAIQADVRAFGQSVLNEIATGAWEFGEL